MGEDSANIFCLKTVVIQFNSIFQLVPVGYGIKKLTIMCTVVDDKVSIEELQEKIEAFEDFVQSCDVAAMNKI